MKNKPVHSNNWLTIRQPEISEAGKIAGLVAKNIGQSFAQYHSAEELRVWETAYSRAELEIQMVEREVFVLQFNDTICGTVQLDGNKIKGFYTDPKGVGFGNILMEFMVGQLRIAGHKWIELTSNEWAVGFYLKHRFTVLDKTMKYYNGHPFEEYTMGRELPGTAR